VQATTRIIIIGVVAQVATAHGNHARGIVVAGVLAQFAIIITRISSSRSHDGMIEMATAVGR